MNFNQKDPNFFSYLNRVSSQLSSSEFSSLKQTLQIYSFQPLNPLTSDMPPCKEDDQITANILLMTKQLEEIPFHKIQLSLLAIFVKKNRDQLHRLLKQKEFLARSFCVCLLRILNVAKKVSLTPFIDFLYDILIEGQKMPNSKDQSIFLIFQTLLVIVSAKYVQHQNEQEFGEQSYLERLIKCLKIFVRDCQGERDFQLIRQLFNFGSYLLIFNQQKIQPLHFYHFVNGEENTFCQGKIHIQVLRSMLNDHWELMKNYIALDPVYHKCVLQIVHRMLALQIGGKMLIAHFEVLVDSLQKRSIPRLKPIVYGLLQFFSEKKINKELIDLFFEMILKSDDNALLFEDSQDFNIQIAKMGDKQRKEMMAKIYYSHYIKGINHQFQKTLINFLLEVNVQQDIFPRKQFLEEFIAQEFDSFSPESIENLHLQIDKNKTGIKLEVIQKILEICKEKYFYKLKPYIIKKHFLQAGNCPFLYVLYLEAIIYAVAGKQKLHIQNYQTIHFHLQNYTLAIDYYPQILKAAESTDIFEDEMFKRFLLCQALLGNKLNLSSFGYFSRYLRYFDINSKLLNLLQRNLVIFKNKNVMLLYLQKLLTQAERIIDKKGEQNFFQIGFLVKLMQDSLYFQVATFTKEAIVIVFQLRLLVSSAKFQQDTLELLRFWSGFLSAVDKKNLVYFFSLRELTRIYPHIHPVQNISPLQKIKSSFNILLDLLAHRPEYLPRPLFSAHGNQLTITLSRDSKIYMNLNLKILRNSNLWSQTSLKLMTRERVYWILLRQQTLTLQTSMKKKKGDQQKKDHKQIIQEIYIKQLKDNQEELTLSLHIQSKKQKSFGVVLKIQHKTILDMILEGTCESVSFKTFPTNFFFGLQIHDGNNLKIELGKNHIVKSRRAWQAHLKSLLSLEKKLFIETFDFEHLFSLMNELIKHFKKEVKISFLYEQTLSFALQMINYQTLHKKDISFDNPPIAFKALNSLFHHLILNIQDFEKINLPDLSCIINNRSCIISEGFFSVLIDGILLKQVWKILSSNCHSTLIALLNKLRKDRQWREKVQQKRVNLFVQLIDLVQDGKQLKDCDIMDLCDGLIQSHSPNQQLNLKFQHYIYVAEDHPFIAKRLSKLVEKVSGFLKWENQNYQIQRILAKFLLIETPNFQILFRRASAQAKVNLLYYMEDSNNLQHTKTLFKLLTFTNPYQRGPLILYLIVNLKHQIHKSKMVKTAVLSGEFSRDMSIGTTIRILLAFWAQIEENEREAMTTIIFELLDQSKGRVAIISKPELENTFSSVEYLKFLVFIIEQTIINYKYDQQLDRLIKNSFQVLLYFHKQSLLSFWVRYRKYASKRIQLMAYPLSLEFLKQIPPSGISVVFQYILECLVIVKDGKIFKQSQISIFAEAVNRLLQFIPYYTSPKIRKPLFYAFPILFGWKYRPDDQILRDQARKPLLTQGVTELRGGLYFKVFAILVKMIELLPSTNFTALIELLLFQDPRNQQFKRAVSIATLDFNQGRVTSKERTGACTLLTELYLQHRNYCLRQDEPMGFNAQIDGDPNLNFFVPDYFLMQLSRVLENQGDRKPELINLYSDIILRALHFFPRIRKDVMERNLKYGLRYLTYGYLNHIVQSETSYVHESFLEQVHSPVIDFIQQKKRKQSGEDFCFRNNQSSFLIPQKIRRVNTADQTLLYKNNAQLLHNLKLNPSSWSTKAKKCRFHLFFCDQAKSILVRELLHEHFVHQSTQEEQTSQKRQRQITKWLDRHQKKIILRMSKQAQERCGFGQATQRVRKIFPYTCERRPILELLQPCLDNMTRPATRLIPVGDYQVKKLRHVQSYAHPEQFLANYNQVVKRQLKQVTFLQQSADLPGESLSCHHYCELITQKNVQFCEWELRQGKILLRTKNQRPQGPGLQYLRFGAPVSSLCRESVGDIFLSLSNIQQIFYRKYNQIHNNSLQFFMQNGCSHFLSFYTNLYQDIFVSRFLSLSKNTKIVRDPAKQFQRLAYCEKWAEGLISNFDYLMLLNKFGGRSLNDLNQYYVFPWVLQDYRSQSLNLNQNKVFRNLSLPVGALNPDKLRRYHEKVKNQDQNSKYLYGSHYSTSLFITYFLVRIQPFSSMHRDLQSGSWDAPDRLFNSVQNMWGSLMNQSASSDIKEAIPEFYYLPSFLKNSSHIDFGSKQCGKEVENVELPRWARSAEHFIVCMRAALESDYVSENLHFWIQLIFGRYQKSLEKHNLFNPYSYAQQIDLSKVTPENLQGTICQINYFGQNPIRLFKKEHRSKKLISEIRNERWLRASPLQKRNRETVQIIQTPKEWQILSINTSLNSQVFNIKLVQMKNPDSYKQILLQADGELAQALAGDLRDFKQAQNQKTEIMVTDRGAELRIGKQLVTVLESPNFEFSRVQFNELFLAGFGKSGLRVFNWQMEQIWKSRFTEEVSSVHLEPTICIYGTHSGQIFAHSFYDGSDHLIWSYHHGSSEMILEVIALPRLPSKDHKNIVRYQILCWIDQRKLALITYCQEHTSSTEK